MKFYSLKTWPIRIVAWPGLLLLGFQADHFQTARKLYESEKYAECLMELQASLQSAEDAPLRSLYTAMCDEQLGRLAEASVQLDLYTSSYPADARGWYWLGNAQLLQRDFESAKKSFDHAVRLNPESTLAHRGLGLAQLELKDYQGAYRSWFKAAELDPKEEKSRYYLGRLFYEADLPDQAAVWLRQAVTLMPDDYEALTYLGLCAEALNLDETALQLYRKAILQSKRQEKPYSKAFLSLGTYLNKHGEQRKALAVLDEGSRSCPEAHELSALGNLLAANHQEQRAETVLRQAIQIDPGLSQPHYRLALLLASQGRTMQSHSEMQKFQDAKSLEDRAPKISVVQTDSSTSR